MKDLALLQAGDLVAYHVLLEDQANSHTVMAMPGTTILRLQKKDLMSILHPSDLEALR